MTSVAGRRGKRRSARWLAFGALVCTLCGCATPRATLESATGAVAPARVELTDVPFFAQERLQCGPAALATVLADGGLEVTPATLEPLVYLPERGGSLEIELLAATRRYDRLAYVIAPQLGDIVAELVAGRPVLVLQNLSIESLPVWHFAVVVGYDVAHERVVLRSGTTERLEMSTRKFMRTWDFAGRWAMVVLEPGELPARADPQSYLEAAAGLEAAGRVDPAVKAYERAIEAWPEEPLAWLGLGNVAYARGRYPAAVTAYREALKRAPGDVAVQNNLADALARAGCIDAARDALADALVSSAGTPLEEQVQATAGEIARAGPAASRCPSSLVSR